MSLLDDLFGGGREGGYQDMARAYDQSRDLIQQNLQDSRGYMNPYYQAGLGGLGRQQQYVQMLGNMLGVPSLGGEQGPGGSTQMQLAGAPGSGSGSFNFQESPYAQYMTQQEVKAANQAANAGGLLGGSQNQRQVMNIAHDIASQDINQQLDRYGRAIGGESQMGYGAAGQMGNWGMTAAEAMANALQGGGQARGYADIARAGGLSNMLGDLFGSFGGGSTGGGGGGGMNPAMLAQFFA
ncbi:MAG: hypothetical protein QF704_11690 [Anaerolineales bacterium]|nr:hypothetical protein [Anaerolineales bacterium]